MTTLKNSYCVPRTVEECIALGVSPMHVDSAIIYKADIDDLCAYDVDDMGEWNTEIPVARFLDLLHDRIVPWRLEEVGFDKHPQGLQKYAVKIRNVGSIVIVFHDGKPQPAIYIMSVKDATPVFITTFTDLLTLIRFLTPNK